MFVIPALKRQQQVGGSEFKPSLVYIKEARQAYNETLSQIKQKVLYSS